MYTRGLSEGRAPLAQAMGGEAPFVRAMEGWAPLVQVKVSGGSKSDEHLLCGLQASGENQRSHLRHQRWGWSTPTRDP